MANETSKRERVLRKQILAGGADLDDYIELADILYKDGRSEATLAILQEASSLKLSPPKDGLLLNEQAQFLFVITGKGDEALALAERAASILRQYPATPETLLAEIGAEGLISKILWDTSRRRAVQCAADVLSKIENAMHDTSQFDPETLWEMCVMALQLHALSGQLQDAIHWARRALAQPVDECGRIAPLIELGCLLRQSGKNEEAKDALETALNSSRKLRRRQNPRIYHELGLVERSLGDLRLARMRFEEALQIVDSDEYLRQDLDYVETLHSEIADVRYRAAFRDYETKNYQSAITQLASLLTEVIGDDSVRSNALLLLGHACFESKRFSRARACYEELINSASTSQYHRDAATSSIERLPRGVPSPPKRVN